MIARRRKKYNSARRKGRGMRKDREKVVYTIIMESKITDNLCIRLIQLIIMKEAYLINRNKVISIKGMERLVRILILIANFQIRI